MVVRLVWTLFALTLIECSALHPQSVTVSPKEITIRQAAGGPFGVGRVASIKAVGEPAV